MKELPKITFDSRTSLFRVEGQPKGLYDINLYVVDSQEVVVDFTIDPPDIHLDPENTVFEFVKNSPRVLGYGAGRLVTVRYKGKEYALFLLGVSKEEAAERITSCIGSSVKLTSWLLQTPLGKSLYLINVWKLMTGGEDVSNGQ